MGFCGGPDTLGKHKAFMIFNKESKTYQGSYCRSYHDDYVFDSVEDARNDNCHGLFQDESVYEIHEVEIQVKRKITK